MDVIFETKNEAEEHLQELKERGGDGKLKKYNGEKCNWMVKETEISDDLKNRTEPFLPLG